MRDVGLDEFLLVVSVLLLVAVLAVWRGLSGLRSTLVGQRGYSLVNITYGLVTAVLISQVVTVINTVLIVVDRVQTVDARVWLFLTVEAVQVTAVIWAYVRVNRLARAPKMPSYSRTSVPEPVEEDDIT